MVENRAGDSFGGIVIVTNGADASFISGWEYLLYSTYQKAKFERMSPSKRFAGVSITPEPVEYLSEGVYVEVVVSVDPEAVSVDTGIGLYGKDIFFMSLMLCMRDRVLGFNAGAAMAAAEKAIMNSEVRCFFIFVLSSL